MTTLPCGTLYGIGVGPGDPDLIPVKAVKILQTVDIIFAAASSKNKHSQAVRIAAPHLPPAARLEMLPFPMTTDAEDQKACWQDHAATIWQALQKGRNAAFLTLGDPMTYATYGYVLQYLKLTAPQAAIVTVPGISAYQAAAARLNRPLVEGEESLLIVSGTRGGAHLRRLAELADNVVFMKAYRHRDDIVAALKDTQMKENSVAIANCTLENEEIMDDIDELQHRRPGYWTLVLAQKKRDHGPDA